jgi:cytosine/adenosine deaminase-related metal-dependent hydrolase
MTTTPSSSLTLRARWVLPVTGPPIENGEIDIQGDRIASVGPASSLSPSQDVRDFGDAILMPGLVNVHAHLDYTVMRGLLEDIAFFPWIRELTARKASLDEADWVASATMGAAEAVAGGVTTLGDCTDSGAALLGAKALGLRGVIYQEVFGIDESQTVEEIVKELHYKVRALRWQASGTNLRIGMSPHAPYTVRPALFRELARYAEEEQLAVCIHAAESLAESELIRHGSGTIGEMFQRRGIGWEIPGMSPVAYLNSLGMLNKRTMLVHGTQLSASDRHLVRESQVAWAHCPKSNAKLGNGVASLGLLRSAYADGEARIGLGSDSVASNNTMDLFEEMRFAVLMQRARSRRYDAMTAREAVEMATMGGARALSLDSQVGSLEPGKQADVIAVRLDGFHALPAYDPYNALVYASGARDVVYTMVGGECVYDGGAFLKTDIKEAASRFALAAQKMRDWTPVPPPTETPSNG